MPRNLSIADHNTNEWATGQTRVHPPAACYLFLKIVLKGLGGVVGTKVESFLDKGIQGYREREDQAF